jgi:tRNA/rRNA methyltransferase
MAGTDRRRTKLSGGPAIILVEPQLGENIGTSARAMFNCGLTDLRLVKPRDGWPNKKAIAAASGADAVLEKATLYDSVEEAISALRHVYATTARDRYMVKRILTPRFAVGEIKGFLAAGEGSAVLFGPERTGLLNEHIALSEAVISVPMNPAFSSLNLAQSVLILGYEWFNAGHDAAGELTATGHSKPATKQQLIRFFEHLEEELDNNGFMRNAEKRPSMVRNLRNLFQRAQCTEQELRTLHGVVTAFAGPRKRKKKAEGV